MPSYIEPINKQDMAKKRKRSISGLSIDDYTEIDIKKQNINDGQGSNSDQKHEINRQRNGIGCKSTSTKSSVNNTDRRIDAHINDDSDSSWKPSSPSSSSSDEENLLDICKSSVNNTDRNIDANIAEESDSSWQPCDEKKSLQLHSALSTMDSLRKALRDKIPSKGTRGSYYNCNIEDRCESSEILWSESTYIIRYIKTCILLQDWRALTALLDFLLEHHKHYSFYIKEIAFLLTMACSRRRPTILETLKTCMVRLQQQEKHRFSIWCLCDEDKF